MMFAPGVNLAAWLFRLADAFADSETDEALAERRRAFRLLYLAETCREAKARHLLDVVDGTRELVTTGDGSTAEFRPDPDGVEE